MYIYMYTYIYIYVVTIYTIHKIHVIMHSTCWPKNLSLSLKSHDIHPLLHQVSLCCFASHVD